MKNLFLTLFILTTTCSQQFHSLDGIEDEQGNTLLLYKIGQQYFPFIPTTTISYQLPEAGYVSLKVFDVLGREVVTLVDEYKNVGSYQI